MCHICVWCACVDVWKCVRAVRVRVRVRVLASFLQALVLQLVAALLALVLLEGAPLDQAQPWPAVEVLRQLLALVLLHTPQMVDLSCTPVLRVHTVER